MSIQLVTITKPTTGAVTVSEVKNQARVTHYNDDDYIEALITSVTESIESRTGYRLFTQTVELLADSFIDNDLSLPGRPDVITLRVAPVASITSIKYYDGDDVDTTISSSDYWEDLQSTPARVQIKSNWPSSNERIANVRIRMIVGQVAANIPEILKLAVKMMAATYYENREDNTDIKLYPIPDGVERLIRTVPEYNHYNTGSM